MGTTNVGAATARFAQALQNRDCDPGLDVESAEFCLAYCPRCGNAERTLHFKQGHIGVVFKCHSDEGCSKEEILALLGMRWRDTFDNPRAGVPDIAQVENLWQAGDLELVETLDAAPNLTRDSQREVAREVHLVFGLYRAAGWTEEIMLTGEWLSERLRHRGVILTGRACRIALADLDRHGYIARVRKDDRDRWMYTEPSSASGVHPSLVEARDQDPTSGPDIRTRYVEMDVAPVKDLSIEAVQKRVAEAHAAQSSRIAA